MEDDLDVNRFVRCDIESCKFGFSGRCHNMLDDVGDVEDGAIVGWYVGIG